ncbi:MAG TPA: hypothetical protein VK590_05420, partial [Saprospiraceae bacterium]|nr:hypothetical protein [Saprospiraceae bacterium]
MKYNFKDIGLIGIAVLFFCGFIMKAYYIPITFDESRTCLYYSQLPIHSIIFYDNPWPTNHVLNSLVIKLFTNIWGISQMVCRIPTLLFSFIYLVYCIKISKIMCNNGFIRISIFIIFLCNPYVNDFFSLARGYGMAISLMMTSIYYLVRFIITPKYALIVYSLGFSFLAVESNFTWLVYFGGLTLCMGLAILYFYKLDKINKEQLVKFVLIEFLITIVTLAFIILPIIKMSSTDQFQYWKGDSFFNVTLVSMFNNFMYSRSYIKIAPEDIMLIWSVLISICLTIGFRLIKNNKSNEFSILSIASILFICTLIVNISQHIILHTPYLIGRTAILYHPLVSFLLSATICFFYNFYS